MASARWNWPWPREDSLMQKFPAEKILPSVFYILLLVSIGITGYIGLSRRANLPNPQLTPGETTEAASVISLTHCEAGIGKICLLSTGYDAQGNLLISLKTALRPMPPIYARLTNDRQNIRFDCHTVNHSPSLLYCLGPFSGNAATTTLKIYTMEDDRLLAAGLFVFDGIAQIPESVGMPEQPTLMPGPYPSQTAASYPSYPTYPAYP